MERKAIVRRANIGIADYYEYEDEFAPKFNKRNLGHKKVSDEQIAAVLRACSGFKSKTANQLGITASWLNQRIKNSPWLQQMEHEINESKIDYSESQLTKNIKKGNLDAIKYHLNYKGKSRGWGVEQIEVQAPRDKLKELAQMIMDGPRDRDMD